MIIRMPNALPNSLCNQRLLTAVASLCLTVTLGQANAAESPYRLNEQLNLSDGFDVSLIHRSRFENIADNVQPGASKNDQVYVMRTLLDMQYQNEQIISQLELADMRQEFADSDSIISTATVNSLDILQATIGYKFDPEGNTTLRFGRFTEDWGSRRMMARNRFRNTINAFDGAVLHTRLAGGAELKAMATQTVTRLPSDRQSLLDNEQQSDRSYDSRRFYGVHLALPALLDSLPAEFYYYAMREKDTADTQTRNRRLNTLGFRLRAMPEAGQFDFEIESMLQTGTQRSSASPLDQIDLDHQAYFQFLSVGYSFPVPSGLRMTFEFDYASGDENPFDDASGRFDSMYGPTAFEFGVVGLYNFFNRSNLASPGVRLTADLSPTVDIMMLYRHLWLAEARDSWGRTGIQDVTGTSGDYLGQHLQLRVRWDIIPGNVAMESGAIIHETADLTNKDPRYAYAGLTFTF
ncbi:MAG: alginate export family protein [Gammaproteobacteria bacterium]